MIDNNRAILYAAIAIVTLIGLRLIFAPAPAAAAMPDRTIRRAVAVVESPVVEAPAPEPGPVVTGELVTIRYSRYDPALGGVNCARFVNGVCISNMASGEPWAPWMELACACPPEWAFGTVVVLDGQRWECQDRGGKIKFVDGVPWVDFLTRTPQYSYGELVTVEVIW